MLSERLGVCTLVGQPADLAAVDLLVTSLLVQAASAMRLLGSRTDRAGTSRTRSFRQSFLVAYAQRVGERLAAATEQAGEGTGRAGELVPVLRRHAEQVDAACTAMFPELVSRPIRVASSTGWAAGLAAADRARLDTTEHLTGALSRPAATVPGVGEKGVGQQGVDRQRLLALRYAVNDEAEQYIAVMRVFTDGTAGLLSDLSAREVADRLGSDHGLDLDPDVVDARLSYLVQAGNLARSPRETEARSIREYLTTRSRYQLTQRGELVHRQVEELLGATEEVREVSTEMLGGILTGLRALQGYDEDRLREVDPDALSGQIATVFAQFERLVTSTRAFYASLGQVLARYDLGREDFQAFKAALLDYLQRFVDQVARVLPQVAEALAALDVPPLLERAAAGARLLTTEGTRARRSTGLEAADWDDLRTWFVGAPGRRSDADEVRALATRAMRALLVNLRRLATSPDREASRYADLVRLARWFDEADADTAAALWAAAFGLYPCRHLGFPGDPEAPTTSSWWRAPVADVPVMLRTSGERKAAGAVARREDFSAVKAQRLRERAEAEAVRTAALEELLARPGPLDGAVLSEAARAAVLELHARALSGAGGPVRREASAVAALPDGRRLRLLVRPDPGSSTTVSRPGGPAAAARPDPRAGMSEDDERRTALRALLLHPMLTDDGPHADALLLVRRHREHLERLCAEGLGYRLVVEPRVARLFKAGLGRDGSRPLRRRLSQGRGRPFDPRGYALLCLLLAALTRSPAQLLLDELVAQVRSAVADAGLAVDLDGVADRRALAAALGTLLELGVLAERDGDLARWVEDGTTQSLLDVRRERLRLLVRAGLAGADGPQDLLDAAALPSAAGGARVAVRRRLLESPGAHPRRAPRGAGGVVAPQPGPGGRLVPRPRRARAGAAQRGGAGGRPRRDAHRRRLPRHRVGPPRRPARAGPARRRRARRRPRRRPRLVPAGRRCRRAGRRRGRRRARPGAAQGLHRHCTAAARRRRGAHRRRAAARRLPARGGREVRAGDQLRRRALLMPRDPHRFRLARAGVLNVWQYDEQVFTFADGRLLLRGTNGAGKSKTLEMLLPFVLDGDKARMTATGRQGSQLLWLMTDGATGGTTRTGYLWVELSRTDASGEQHVVTCGIGIRHSTSARQAVTWQFTVPTACPELAEPDGTPLSAPRCRERVAALGGQSFEAPRAYKEHVGRLLFGLEPRAYDDLLRLLYWLRQPQVGEDLDPRRLVEMLDESLPALDEDAVRQVGEALDDLQEHGERVERLAAAADAVATSARVYARYAGTVLAERAAAARTAERDRAGRARRSPPVRPPSRGWRRSWRGPGCSRRRHGRTSRRPAAGSRSSSRARWPAANRCSRRSSAARPCSPRPPSGPRVRPSGRTTGQRTAGPGWSGAAPSWRRRARG